MNSVTNYQAPAQTMPEDTVYEVMNNLSLKDAVDMGLVCKRWKQITSNTDQSYWKIRYNELGGSIQEATAKESDLKSLSQQGFNDPRINYTSNFYKRHCFIQIKNLTNSIKSPFKEIAVLAKKGHPHGLSPDIFVLRAGQSQYDSKRIFDIAAQSREYLEQNKSSLSKIFGKNLSVKIVDALDNEFRTIQWYSGNIGGLTKAIQTAPGFPDDLEDAILSNMDNVDESIKKIWTVLQSNDLLKVSQ